MKKIFIVLAGVLFSIVTSLSVAQSTAIDDSEIASILNTVNLGEIKAATNAQSKASNPEVRKYAQLMITDHKNANQSAKTVFKKLKIKPQPGMYSRNLKKENNAAMRKMKKLQGNSFDHAYMESQEMMHQTVLNMIDSTLLPNAKNEEVKTLITNMRPVIDAHLQQAKQIRASMQ
jgi:putative membrane protein